MKELHGQGKFDQYLEKLRFRISEMGFRIVAFTF